MVLQNYVILENNVPARLHFSDHVIQQRTVTDPLSRQAVSKNVLVMTVDRLNAQPVSAQYSVMAEKHAAQLGPYLQDKQYRAYDFIITRIGEGFLTSWTVKVIPLK